MAKLMKKAEEVFSSAAFSEERLFSSIWKSALQRFEDIFEAVGRAEGGERDVWDSPYWVLVPKCKEEDEVCFLHRNG